MRDSRAATTANLLRPAQQSSSLRGEVASHVQDQLRGTLGLGISLAVDFETIAMLEVIAPALVFQRRIIEVD